jgi:5-methylcytosine-specific restriction endonuclease McrA
MDDAKQCTGCRKTKALDEFSPKRGGKLGRHAQCKLCRAAARVADRAANPERARAVDRKAEQNRKQTSAQRSAAWRAANPERHRIQSQQNRARRRAVQAAATVGKVCYESLYAFFLDCYLCGQPLAGATDVDHIVPLARGGAHCQDNLRPTHEACNLRKSDKFLAELDWYAGPVDIGVGLCHDGATPTNEGTTP